MKLVFLYARERGQTVEAFKTEGLWYLFRKMVEAGVVDAVDVVVETSRNETCTENGCSINLVTNFKEVEKIVRPGDVIWTRGGFKPWLDHIEKWVSEKHWMLFYGANTGRERWPYWDIILHDLTGKNYIDPKGRLVIDYRKPINPEVFFYKDTERIYDVCIGASYIHDKKGQFKAVNALEYLKKKGVHLTAIMPGAYRHSEQTRAVIKKVPGLDIDIPGFVSRHEMCDIYNQSKLFLHMGSGQNDRGVLEAMACGCPCLMTQPQYHAPFTYNDNAAISLEDNAPAKFAEAILLALKRFDGEQSRLDVYEKFITASSTNDITLPMMDKLFTFFEKYPEADKSKLKELL